MKPLFIYPIPQSSAWYIIITDTSHHFYFNAKDGHSYWQLSDLAENYNDINTKQLLSSVNYDQLGLLFAKARGLRVETSRSGKCDRGNGGDDTIRQGQKDVSDEVEIVYQNEYTQDDANEIAGEPAVNIQDSDSSALPSKGIVFGYSSSEDDDDDEENDELSQENQQKALPKKKDEVDNIVSQVLHQNEDEQEQSDNESQISLDLSVDEEEELKNNNTTVHEFRQMLNNFASSFSSFDSWDIIEDQLVGEFIKYPVYHSIGSREEKREIFQNWLDSRDDDNEESNTSASHDVDAIFPTEKMLFLSLLQQHKDQVKTSFYQEFYTANYKEMNNIDLPKLTKEDTYRNYKKFILDFAKFEKDFKKTTEYTKGVNVKVMKLQEYLSSRSDFPSGVYTIDSNLSFFKNWVQLLNQYFDDVTIAESEINFLLGDEKRLHSYITKLNEIRQ
ncbi:hypothetical protein CANMA_005289 [Candida margitis]|uniref:uncharacterized protein n=1 Tax=Candida margitis TaxID=1775924 RepID=UPI002225C226|nr:uncharacterized protein CANMA_005289 [Candida margitis]KAI5950629.1 hypothetical protein CANMA_005289 [Candida margitis]